MKGLIFALLTALFWGVAPIIEKVSLGKTEPVTAMAVRSFSVAAFIATFFFFSGRGGSLKSLAPSTVLLIVAGGVFGAILGQFTYFTALKTGYVSQVVPISASYPLVAALLSIIILGEPLTISRLGGIIFVLAGIFLLRL